MNFQFSEQNEPPQIILGQVKHFSNLKWIFNIFSVINFCQFKILCMKNANNAFKNVEAICFRIVSVLDFIFLTSVAW